MHALQNAAVELAVLASNRVLARRRAVFGPWRGARINRAAADFVHSAREDAERAIRSALTRTRRVDRLLGDQSGAPDSVCWVINTIDSASDFVRGLLSYAVSSAACVDSTCLASAVAEPETGRIWTAARGRGAWAYDPRKHDNWVRTRPTHTPLTTS